MTKHIHIIIMHPVGFIMNLKEITIGIVSIHFIIILMKQHNNMLQALQLEIKQLKEEINRKKQIQKKIKKKKIK